MPDLDIWDALDFGGFEPDEAFVNPSVSIRKSNDKFLVMMAAEWGTKKSRAADRLLTALRRAYEKHTAAAMGLSADTPAHGLPDSLDRIIRQAADRQGVPAERFLTNLVIDALGVDPAVLEPA